MALVVDPGKVVDHMQLTPEMCATWFKYITPVLAGAATAEGQLSMSLQGARVPLTSPMAANIQGQAEIHGARVQPGPMAAATAREHSRSGLNRGQGGSVFAIS